MAMAERQIRLVVEAGGGDVKSFDELYEIYYKKVYALIRMVIGKPGEAEDILQETFATAWRKLKTLDTPSSFPVWIQILAKNLCDMRIRKKSLAILLEADRDIDNIGGEETDELFPSAYAERTDLYERFGKTIESLSDVQRQIIVLFYFNDLSVDEISDVMGCSANTVKIRLFLARRAIFAEIAEQERKSGETFIGAADMPTVPFRRVVNLFMDNLILN